MRHARRIVVLLAVLAGCSIPDGEYFGKIRENPDPTHFIWCNSGEPEFLDPANASSNTDIRITDEMFDGITSYGPEANPVPSLATSWEISKDQKTFTFHLRRDAKWSNGRPFTSKDVAYGWARVLHPLTASTNAETLWKILHGQEYTAGRAKLILRDVAPFRAGDVVQVVWAISKNKKGEDEEAVGPDSNARTTRREVVFHEWPDSSSATYHEVPAGKEVTLIELGGPGCPNRPNGLTKCDWAYVYYTGTQDGIYGWIPVSDLDEPNAAVMYHVVSLDDKDRKRWGMVNGRDLAMLPDLLGIDTPDDYTVVVRLKGPTPYFLNLTVQRMFRPTPREAVSRRPRRWVKPEYIVTSGPFHLTYWRERDKIELVKSGTFWGKERVRLERVTIFGSNDQSANANMYYQGTCDALVGNNIPNSYMPVLGGEVGGQRRKDYERAEYIAVYFYLINNKKHSNVHFRRALAHALDRNQLPGLLKSGAVPSEGYTPGTRHITELSDAELSSCGFTRAEAEAKAAGGQVPPTAMFVHDETYGKICYVVPQGAGFDLKLAKQELEIARRELGNEFPNKLTIKYNTGVEQHKTIAEWVQSQWESNLGIKVETESQEWKTYLKSTRTFDYDIGRFGNIGNFPDPEAEFLPTWKCASPDNRVGFCSKEYDGFLEQAEQEADRKKRLGFARQAEQILMDQQALLPLFVYKMHNLRKPYVKDLYSNDSDHQSLREVWIDPDWRKHLEEAKR